MKRLLFFLVLHAHIGSYAMDDKDIKLAYECIYDELLAAQKFSKHQANCRLAIEELAKMLKGFGDDPLKPKACEFLIDYWTEIKDDDSNQENDEDDSYQDDDDT